MLFNKKLVTIAVLASSMVAGSALAADEVGKKSTEVRFKAQLRAASCDVASTAEGSVIDWGTFTLDQTNGKNVKDQLGSDKNFNLILTNCSKAAAEDAAIFVHAEGKESPLFPEYFANTGAKSLAVALSSGGKDIKPNVDTELKFSNAVDVNGSTTIPVLAKLLLTQVGVAPDTLNVPVTFSVSYN
ncbi:MULTISPECIES: fimbrial protein [Providencia]|uniref:Fimbrial subunit n=1 Tax=Providencia stuartii (strain MRSN 2154) TaxID=1157951 RepID=A0A140NN02_PROSM|nr:MULTISPECIES: fimbrial protein [Providencia]AFH93536.1 fimbrial subunit [Providencia stuartii MRSN 2154]APG51519.1 fimbrial protein [Providencia stuartii]AVE41286.1 type 1 fimbrial protein [Providencia stuartii]AVL38537.1 type 1 fimbrial protein [Providencia stuartii]EMF0919224.1 type 1 fimbrial protein [Providencia stuartii]